MKEKLLELLWDLENYKYPDYNKKADEILLLFSVVWRSEQVCQWHDWVKHPSHPKIGAMICKSCRTELA